MIIYLREHRAVALHIACGDITDVFYDGDIFIINTEEEILYDLLKTDENLCDLKNCLSSFGVDKFEIRKKEKKNNKIQEDINKLKNIFDDKFIVE